MKKKPAFRSAFFNPRVLISFAVCAIGVLLALLAFALYPGGNARAQGPQQAQSSVPEFTQENVNIAEGTVVSITATPLEGSGLFDAAPWGRAAHPADASSEFVRRRDWYRHP